MTVIGNLGYVAVCVIGAALVMDGEIGFGVIVAFIMYVRLFTSPLSTLAQGMTQMQTAAAAGGHIFSFLHAEELPEEPGKLDRPEEVRGEVEFEHVRFAYPDSPEKVIIKDFSAHIQPGQKVAIVGPTGAGKTTLVNLLMCFYEINSGSIDVYKRQGMTSSQRCSRTNAKSSSGDTSLRQRSRSMSSTPEL